MRKRQQIVATIGIAAATTGMSAPTASADGQTLAGGAGITVNGNACTLTTIGHDKRGDLVGFTAASCGGPGASVAACAIPSQGFRRSR